MSKQKVLITGASTGFGNITAKLLAENGHTVYATMRDVNGKNKPHKEALLDWAKAEQANIKVVELDVTSDQSVENAKEQILTDTNGSMDVIINNAGIYGGGIQEAFTVNDHKALFEVNVFGTVRINNAFLPTLRKQKSGLIIQISSILGRVIIPFGGVYDATKWTVEALSENLAYELKPLGIDVAIVQPGPFLTDLVNKLYQPENLSIVNEYGKSAEYLKQFSQNFINTVSDPNIPNKPEQVADAILKLVETQNGTRPLRTVVDKLMGGVTEIINDTSSNVQAGLLQNFGLSELNSNNSEIINN
ncbi:MAG: SDR family oxidoreductase [Bacteroidetes bacterium]|nr:MAG: SDR family oxidoreductase [Bacteroidota bacterium]